MFSHPSDSGGMVLKALMEKFTRQMSELHHHQQQQAQAAVAAQYYAAPPSIAAVRDEDEGEPGALMIADDIPAVAAASGLRVDVEDVVVDVTGGGAGVEYSDGDEDGSDCDTRSTSASSTSVSVDEGLDSAASSSVLSPTSSITNSNPHLHKALMSGTYAHPDLISDTASTGSSSGVYSPTGGATTAGYPEYIRRAGTVPAKPEAADAPAGGGGGKAKKVRRRCRSRNRLRWSGEQLKTMEHYFTAINAYPSLGEYQALAGILDVTVKHVQIWFTNRRVKYKRLHREKAVKNPLSKVAVLAGHGDTGTGTGRPCGPLGPLYNPILLTAPPPVVAGATAVPAASTPQGAAVAMTESVIPRDINPIHYVSSLPLQHAPGPMPPLVRASAKPEKICSVVVRDDHHRRVSPTTPSPVPVTYQDLYEGGGAMGSQEQPLDLSVPAARAAAALALEYRRHLDDLSIASSALLHLSGGGYNSGVSPPAAHHHSHHWDRQYQQAAI